MINPLPDHEFLIGVCNTHCKPDTR